MNTTIALLGPTTRLPRPLRAALAMRTRLATVMTSVVTMIQLVPLHQERAVLNNSPSELERTTVVTVSASVSETVMLTTADNSQTLTVAALH